MQPLQFVKTVTTLQVEKIASPREWLNCIQWSRYQKLGSELSSLELFVVRPFDSNFYYAVGEEGTILMCRDSTTKTLKLNRDTVSVLTGGSNDCCLKPMIRMVDEHPELQEECLDNRDESMPTSAPSMKKSVLDSSVVYR